MVCAYHLRSRTVTLIDHKRIQVASRWRSNLLTLPVRWRSSRWTSCPWTSMWMRCDCLTPTRSRPFTHAWTSWSHGWNAPKRRMCLLHPSLHLVMALKMVLPWIQLARIRIRTSFCRTRSVPARTCTSLLPLDPRRSSSKRSETAAIRHVRSWNASRDVSATSGLPHPSQVKFEVNFHPKRWWTCGSTSHGRLRRLHGHEDGGDSERTCDEQRDAEVAEEQRNGWTSRGAATSGRGRTRTRGHAKDPCRGMLAASATCSCDRRRNGVGEVRLGSKGTAEARRRMGRDGDLPGRSEGA
mmetsp:Transcript_324/g.2588  ORF Transcript_324/g.2588 Transcript_324/m.2588 type:complete len:297 (-) Transcript_324:1840-2730(-)